MYDEIIAIIEKLNEISKCAENTSSVVSAKPPRGLNKRSKSDKLNPKGSEEVLRPDWSWLEWIR